MKNKLHIGVDARPLIIPNNGNARYLYRMLKELFLLPGNIHWSLFSNRPIHREFSHLLEHSHVSLIQPGPGEKSLPGPLWVNFQLPPLLARENCHLFWGTLAMLPWIPPAERLPPMVVNFHDLNSFVAPSTMTLANRIQHRLLDGRVLRRARKIICLSETTGQDILHFFPRLDSNALCVVYPGVDRPLEVRKRVKPAALPSSFQSFWITVGTIEPRKNQITLIHAYRDLFKKGIPLPPLLIAGKKGWGESETHSMLASGELTGEGIHYLPEISDEELAWCYGKATHFFYPSLHEGFGLPLLEAMSYGLAIVTSDIPVFREVARGARFCGAADVEEWKTAMLEAREGKVRATRFAPGEYQWVKRAEKLLSLLTENAGIR